MAHLPVVAIVGRPNVGKSALFNRLLRERVSIEESYEGVTRDRVIRQVKIRGKFVDLVDTGGIGIVDRQDLEEDVKEQIEFALAGSDVVLFVVDGSNSITDLDTQIAQRLRREKLTFILVTNKVDHESVEGDAALFYGLGMGEPVNISALHDRGIDKLMEKLFKLLPDDCEKNAQEDTSLRLALAGRRNVGKSSFVNLLCGSKRVIVSDQPGTTRDSIDVRAVWKDQEITLIDTAGLRKKNQTDDSIEFFSVSRTFGAMWRADLIYFMVDCVQGLSQVDQNIGRWIKDNHKPCVLVVNKWDLAKGVEIPEYRNYIHSRLPFLTHVPIAMISVLKGTGLDALHELTQEVRRQMAHPTPTPLLNRCLQEAQQRQLPKVERGKIPKLMYATRINGDAPTFLIFGKGLTGLQDAYKRYLEAYLRKKLNLSYAPLKIIYKNQGVGESGSRRHEQKA